jgi:hypothetical protein
MAIPMSAQIIDNRRGGAFRDEIFFNQLFLAKNKISKISVSSSVKSLNKPIQNLPDMTVFYFDEHGQLKQMDKITSIVQWVDTLSILYQRTSPGVVKEIQNSSTRGYTTTKYTYDDKGRAVYVEYGSAENIATEPGKIQPGREFILNAESYQWVDEHEGLERCKLLNNYGLHYATKSVTRGADGYILKEEEELVMSGTRTSNIYQYNDHGWIASITHTGKEGREEKTIYSYDDFGNVWKAEFFSGGDVVREVQILYTSTKLIEAILDQDKQSQQIKITKYTYQYRD